MTILSVIFGFAAISCFYFAASDNYGESRRYTLFGGIGFVLALASILTTPQIAGDDCFIDWDGRSNPLVCE